MRYKVPLFDRDGNALDIQAEVKDDTGVLIHTVELMGKTVTRTFIYQGGRRPSDHRFVEVNYETI